MYNTRSSSGNSHGNPYTRKIEAFRQQQPPPPQQQISPPQQQLTPPPPPPQQQQQAMSLGSNCITTPKSASSMKNQQPLPLHDLPSQSPSPNPVAETPIPNTSVTQSSTIQDYQNKRIKLEDEKSISEKSEVKWPVKRKISKKERKKRLNARMRRLVSPKSPLMVFSELFKDVPIHLQEHPLHNVMSYTATLEVDGQMYSGNHISKTQAKQKACENFLRIMLAKKISERSEKKEELPMEVEMEIGENSSVSKPKGPPQEDFPWPHFASLAMHNLINQWELQPVVTKANYVQEEPNVIKSQPKTGAMRKFPENPKNCNPIQLINQMKPGVKFVETIISSKTPSLFQVNCVIDDVSFTGQGSTKKAAKKECCIAAIKSIWQFDFHAIEDN
ncbi:uncharacterized protein LOC132932054 [Rhopalosiphum padi]|uniref:uncharacterized protein LOC132932054 n=1 Tax=Rhopalosiphum padi TaxID=40932 RepID=UPI00298ED03E|nr:uncharacterized protein LOC132932054 [Rhopalosiphum padi]